MQSTRRWYTDPNRLKARLLAGDTLLGLWSSLNSPAVGEILADSGADWVLVDMEHGPADVASVVAHLQAMTGYPADPVVRVPAHDEVLFKRLLDCGVRSFIVPAVDTAEQAEAVVAMTRYPPGGRRGVSGSPRASGYGRRTDYHRQADSDLCLVLQVESASGVAAAAGIAGVAGVDAVFIGPADLAASLGHLGNPAAPEVERAIERARRGVADAGKPAGIFSSPARARAHIEQGFRFVSVGSDTSLLARGSDELIAGLGPLC